MDSFEKKLEKYAELAINVGINLKEKEGLILQCSTDTLPLARKVLKKAYAAGAKHVEIKVSDDKMKLIRYKNGKPFVFENFPKWKVDAFEAMYKDNYHQLFITAPDPELLKDIDNDILAKEQKSTSKAIEPIMKYRMSGQVKWCIIATPSEAWAKSVFPNLTTEKAYDKLWKKIFKATRVDQKDPTAAWKKHDEALKKYKKFLNEKNFEKLVFEAPGTNLECYLANDHHWMGGSKISTSDDSYVANIPTEEVFTTPHYLKVNGKLKATKPLSHNGKIINEFGFEFKDGKVIDFFAKKGYDVLKKLLENDEGAKYLGEVALVPDDSPISNTNILFKNTLFDENASVHFALGRSYAYAMKNGVDLSRDELKEKGANDSLIHVDFMVGGPEMNITAYTKSDKKTKIFENGNWII